MTKILKSHIVQIQSAMNEMMSHMPANAHLPLDTFLRLFFTEKQREQMAAVQSFVDMNRVSTTTPLMDTYTQVPEFIPHSEGTARPVKITIAAHWRYNGFQPREWVFHPNAAPEDIDAFNTCIEQVTLRGIMRRLWTDLMDMYTIQMVHHEEMRYLFPGTVHILRAAELHDIANAVENVKRRPDLQVSAESAKMFRFMNQWFATQLLLGTFEGDTTYSHHVPDRGTVTLRLFRTVDVTNHPNLLVA